MSTPQKLLKGFLYTLGSGYMARLASVVLTIQIRNQLQPSVFGDAVLGVTAFTLLASPREFGLMYGLLHFQDRTRDFVETHFTLNLIICGLALVLGLGGALALSILWSAKFTSTVAFTA